MRTKVEKKTEGTGTKLKENTMIQPSANIIFNGIFFFQTPEMCHEYWGINRPISKLSCGDSLIMSFFSQYVNLYDFSNIYVEHSTNLIITWL